MVNMIMAKKADNVRRILLAIPDIYLFQCAPIQPVTCRCAHHDTLTRRANSNEVRIDLFFTVSYENLVNN